MMSPFDFSRLDQRIAELGVRDILVDVDNTVVKANITHLYLHLKRKALKPRIFWYLWCLYFGVVWAPVYLLLDFIDRDQFQRAFYRRYGEFTLEQLERGADELFREKYNNRFIEYTYELIRHLKQKGIQVTLLSTNIDCVVRRFGQYFDVPYICLQAEEDNGFARINLSDLNQFKLRAAMRFSPSTTMAIADSKHDLPVLTYVSLPIVVSRNRRRWMSRLGKSLILAPDRVTSKSLHM